MVLATIDETIPNCTCVTLATLASYNKSRACRDVPLGFVS